MSFDYTFRRGLLGAVASTIDPQTYRLQMQGLLLAGDRIVGGTPKFLTVARDASPAARGNPGLLEDGKMPMRHVSLRVDKDLLRYLIAVNGPEFVTISLRPLEAVWDFGHAGPGVFTRPAFFLDDLTYPDYLALIRKQLEGKVSTKKPVVLERQTLEMAMKISSILRGACRVLVSSHTHVGFYGLSDPAYKHAVTVFVRYMRTTSNPLGELFSVAAGLVPYHPRLNTSTAVTMADLLPDWLKRPEKAEVVPNPA